MKIKELKEHLQDVLDNLESFDEEQEVLVVRNTYWLRGGTHFIALPSLGFVDLDYPTNDKEDGEEDL